MEALGGALLNSIQPTAVSSGALESVLANLDGHEHGKTRYFVYNGGAPKFVRRLGEVAAEGYKGLALT